MTYQHISRQKGTYKQKAETYRHTCGQADTDTLAGKQIQTYMQPNKVIQTGRYKHTGKQANTGVQTGRQADTSIQTGRYRHTCRQTDTDIQACRVGKSTEIDRHSGRRIQKSTLKKS